MSPLALALLLSLVSAVAYAAGAIVQEQVAASTAARPYAPLHHAGWWGAVALNGTGALLHVVALAYGPLSVVQPLGALTIVFALPMAAMFVGRRAGATAWRGALLATIGLAGLMSLSGSADSGSLGSGERGVLAAVTFGVVALVFLVAQTIHRPVLRSVLLATCAGVAFGIASVFTKTVAVDWDWSAPLAQWSSLLTVAVLAIGGLLLSQASYRGAGLAAPLATVTVVNPVVAAAVGITMFGETFRYGFAGTLLAMGFGAMAAAGLVLLTVERMTAAGHEATAAEPGAGEVRTEAEAGDAQSAAVSGVSMQPVQQRETAGSADEGSDGPGTARNVHRTEHTDHTDRADDGVSSAALVEGLAPAGARAATPAALRIAEQRRSGFRACRSGRPKNRSSVERRPSAAPSADLTASPTQRSERSERDAARPEVGHGVDVGPVSRSRADFEVKMGP
ncbi:DMT family transporter [Streptomyces sp. NPDC047315]|uniref:DMT family transporter n=1 Tax=Streptomyces sp. NPDC047315 TaxID=3155142 RepID=UPI0034044392